MSAVFALQSIRFGVYPGRPTYSNDARVRSTHENPDLKLACGFQEDRFVL